jgi:hypothetical protein
MFTVVQVEAALVSLALATANYQKTSQKQTVAALYCGIEFVGS